MNFGAFLGRKLPLMIASFFWGKTGICPIIETVVFLGCQNLPFRGHRDDGLLGEAWSPWPPSVSTTALHTQEKKLGAWTGVFKPKTQNIKTCILLKLLHWFQPNFAQWQRPPNALCEWSKHANHNLWTAWTWKNRKSPHITNSLTDHYEMWYLDAVWPLDPSDHYNSEILKIHDCGSRQSDKKT